MTLRRTALTRRTELKRAPMPRRTKAAKERNVATIRRQRDTGPSPRTRAIVLDRAEGCCEVCTKQLHDGADWYEVHSFHHRQPRGMGGTTRPDVNSPANLLLLCGTGTTGCHGWIERHRTWARVMGYLVAQHEEPTLVVVELSDHRHVTLTHDGTYQEAA